jgi:hypothetical protein
MWNGKQLENKLGDFPELECRTLQMTAHTSKNSFSPWTVNLSPFWLVHWFQFCFMDFNKVPTLLSQSFQLRISFLQLFLVLFPFRPLFLVIATGLWDKNLYQMKFYMIASFHLTPCKLSWVLVSPCSRLRVSCFYLNRVRSLDLLCLDNLFRQS